MTDTSYLDKLREAALLLPIRIEDGPDYASAFGQDFQAMTITPDRFRALNSLPDAIAEIERLRSALEDLLSWFPAKPSAPEWRIEAGERGADRAVDAARAAIAGDDGHD